MSNNKFTNTLWTRDNIDVLQGLNSDLVDLIYLDPPFNSKRMYSAPIGSKAAGTAFKDIWTWSDVDEVRLERLVIDYPAIVKTIEATQLIDKTMAAYLTYMAQRFIEMKRILKPTGTIYLHCDPTASHYLKLLLDGIFDRNYFRNEIIWCYAGGGIPKSDFPRKHDVILRYTKTNRYTYNPVYREYSEGTKKRGRTQVKGKYFEEGLRAEGTPVNDWWTDVPKITSPTDPEKTGYPTQKPLALLHRIINVSSNEGDIVLDPFCGCATACVASQQLQRNWIGIDIEAQASKILIERLSDDAGLFSDFVHRTDAPHRTDIKEEIINKSIKDRLFSIQEGVCAGCGNTFDKLNLEVDHIIPKSKGGGDYFENYQLLCGSCNRIKGARPMEYLRQKIKVREAAISKISFGD